MKDYKQTEQYQRTSGDLIGAIHIGFFTVVGVAFLAAQACAPEKPSEVAKQTLEGNYTPTGKTIEDIYVIRTHSDGNKKSAIAFDIGDVNGDGTLELVVGDLDNVRIYQNDGKGNFTNPNIICYPDIIDASSEAVAVRLADIDTDKDLDLLIGDTQGIMLYYNDGRGNFDWRYR